MIFAAIGFFALALILGILLLSYLLRDKNIPRGLAFVHGPAALIGIILLIIYSFYHSPAPIIIIILFVIVASGGLIMIYRHLTGRVIPKWLGIAHGLLALLSFFLLIAFTLLTAIYQ